MWYQYTYDVKQRNSLTIWMISLKDPKVKFNHIPLYNIFNITENSWIVKKYSVYLLVEKETYSHNPFYQGKKQTYLAIVSAIWIKSLKHVLCRKLHFVQSCYISRTTQNRFQSFYRTSHGLHFLCNVSIKNTMTSKYWRHYCTTPCPLSQGGPSCNKGHWQRFALSTLWRTP